jgi:hypothetical protein
LQQESWQLLVSSIGAAIGAATGSLAGAGGPQQSHPIVGVSVSFRFSVRILSVGAEMVLVLVLVLVLEIDRVQEFCQPLETGLKILTSSAIAETHPCLRPCPTLMDQKLMDRYFDYQKYCSLSNIE